MGGQNHQPVNRRIAAGTMLLIVLSCVGCENKLESAKKLWQENNQDQAISKLKEELTKNPGNADATKLLEVYQTKVDQQNLEKIAIDAIRKNNNYPHGIVSLYHAYGDSPIKQEIIRLVRESFLIQQGNDFIPTEKGKDIIKSANYSFVWGFSVEIKSHIEDVSKINEILVDSKNGVASVKYSVGFTPTEYFNSLKKIDGQLFDDNYTPVVRKKEISFKKWDNGWRIQ